MDEQEALRIYERIQNINQGIHDIHRKRIPYARMMRGKCDKRGDIDGSGKWGREILRLYELINADERRLAELRQRLADAGYKPDF